MAINLDVQDVDQYPGTTKRVTIDQDTIVPAGMEGDEKFVVKITTTAYSDNTVNTAIQDLYIMDYDIGWIKSNGLAGAGGKFALDATHNTLRIKMDATVSGSDGSGYYPITLEYNTNGMSKTGETIAADMETKINAISCVTADTGYQLAYSNASVEFKNGKFWITSGTIGRSYTGAYRSSVAVASGTTNDCSTLLGFNTSISSEGIANTAVAEALITQDYTADSATLYIGAGTGVSTGDCAMITADGTTKDYFTILSVAGAGTTLTVPTMGTNGYTGISNSYTVASGTKVQILREQDPDNEPNSWCTSFDDLVRYGIKNIVNQIDFS